MDPVGNLLLVLLRKARHLLCGFDFEEKKKEKKERSDCCYYDDLIISDRSLIYCNIFSFTIIEEKE